MAQQDVRYYLNGLLLEASKTYIKAIATDGHRLAINSLKHSQNVNPFQIIIPRKAVIELLRLLDSESEEEITLIIGTNFLRVFIKHYIFTTRLIDGRFPSYEKVIPQANDKKLMLDKDSFKQSLSRVAILANAKSKGVCLQLRNNLLRITSHNNEQDKAEEEIITE
ncbi:MAG: Beta sliding clamp [Legionellaceae bacterium]